MYRVLILTDAITLNSGLARCGRELCGGFYNHPDYQVYQAGWHSLGVPHSYPVEIFPIVRGVADEPERLFHLIGKVRPHFMVCIGDPFYFAWLAALQEKVSKELSHTMHFLGWITLDGDPLQPSQLDLLRPFHRVLPMSQFAKNEIQKAAQKALSNEEPYSLGEGPDAVPSLKRLLNGAVLYPGVNSQLFHPRPGTTWTFKDHKINRDLAHLSLIVDQNTSRKAIGTAIDAWDDFQDSMEDKEKHFLYLACDANDPNGMALDDVVAHCKGRDRIFCRNVNPINAMPEEELAQVYAVASVLFSCTSGEGFKLPIIEAMATGCIPVMPDYTSPPELLQAGRGILIRTDPGAYWYGSWAYRKRIVSKAPVIAALREAYEMKVNNQQRYVDMQRKAFRFAVSHTWDKTFNSLVTELMNLHRKQPLLFQAA